MLDLFYYKKINQVFFLISSDISKKKKKEAREIQQIQWTWPWGQGCCISRKAKQKSEGLLPYDTSTESK